jgi:hypothetical protein
LTLVFEESVAGPATHAIVIGVGAYAHLPGGTGTVIPNAPQWGIGQLTSPPLSALAFTSWLVDRFRNPDRPLATVDLYVSASAPTSFTPSRGAHANQALAIDRALWDSVEAGVVAWAKRCVRDEDLAVFYFCGHGVARGQLTSLLVEDFASNDLSPMQKTLRFDDFVLGLEQCRARNQALFVDACTSTPTALNGLVGTTLGQAIIEPNTTNRPSALPRDLSWIQGANRNSAAFGKPNEPSQFTRSLVRALDEGPAWDDNREPWTLWDVHVESLAGRLRELMVLEQEIFALPPQQARQCSPDLSGFVLHQPDPALKPKVPVLVRCDPRTEAKLAIKREELAPETREPSQEDWCVTLPVDPDYRAEAHDSTGKQLGEREFIVRPPCQRVVIPTGGS